MSLPITLLELFPEAWSAALIEAAPAMESLPLSPRDAKFLGSCSRYFRAEGGDFRSEGHSPALEAGIAAALELFPGGVMPRIGYCSWKASMLHNRPLRSMAEVMQVITADDPRIGFGILGTLLSGRPVVLHLREWIEIPRWSEFRVFARAGRVVGVSQYFHHETFPEIAQNLPTIHATIRAFLIRIWPELPSGDLVIDLALLPDTASGPEALRAVLLELNPMTPQTDACLFDWTRGGDFDGQLRYNPSVALRPGEDRRVR